MSNFSRGTNYAVFGIGLLVATIVALAIIPGLDILARHLLKPEGYGQGIILLALEILTAPPRLFFAIMLWLGISKFAAEIA